MGFRVMPSYVYRIIAPRVLGLFVVLTNNFTVILGARDITSMLDKDECHLPFLVGQPSMLYRGVSIAFLPRKKVKRRTILKYGHE